MKKYHALRTVTLALRTVQVALLSAAYKIADKAEDLAEASLKAANASLDKEVDAAQQAVITTNRRTTAMIEEAFRIQQNADKALADTVDKVAETRAILNRTIL